ncbi:MAG: hypothetical protein AB7V36_06695 [Bacteroidales bacterium]
MKSIIVVTVFLLIIAAFGKAQDKLVSTFRDSVDIDSVEVINKKLLLEFEKFYDKNKKSIDDKTYFLIDIMEFKDNDTSSFLLIISIGIDIENDLHWVKENESGFFRFNKRLVLITSLKVNLNLFNRVNKKQFYFNRRENIFVLPTTKAGYKVKKTMISKTLIRRIFYIKYPYTKIQYLCYKIRYGKHF